MNNANLSVENLKSEYDYLFSFFKDENPDWAKVLRLWNELKIRTLGDKFRIEYQLAQDVRVQSSHDKETFFRERLNPIAEAGDLKLVQMFLKPEIRRPLESEFGEYFFKRLALTQTTLADMNSSLRIEEGEYTTKYNRMVGSAEITVDGETMTLSRARSLYFSPAASIRKEAYAKSRGWFLEKHAELSDIFNKLVSIRTRMGSNLGDKNYISLGFKRMERTDYASEECAEFRRNTLKYLVPLQSKLFQKHARELGTDQLSNWDTFYMPSLSLPMGIAPVKDQLDQMQKVFQALSPELCGHFRNMRHEGLIDLENRTGKQAGAFCTAFPDEKKVLIFCNSTGGADDLRTLAHEMGHAFQGWESQGIELVELRWPTLDACEIHSMGMEYLSLPKMGVFFTPDQLQRFRISRMKEAVELICYIAVVDEFQHRVYESPAISPAERDHLWCELWDRYKPGLSFAGLEETKKARWYGQGHIFNSPFYYIDYAIAEMGALQLGWLAKRDLPETIEKYLALCRVGGTQSLKDIFSSADLRSPFDESLFHDISKYLEHELAINGGDSR